MGYKLQHVVEEAEEMKIVPTLPAIPQPQTPQEPMEFLSRSWSPDKFPKAIVVPQLTGKIVKSVNNRRMKSMGKWFHHKEFTSSTVKKKDKERVERARLPSPLQELLQPWLL
ncbi:unnamed protein product [Prunus armeniaca]|uniref:Uncharacterized protein n=1 Tax=Prunus armeniaca TaxID=36596 RepID=A0A6J5V0E6_PRUAR|nr:unnamed protein product [Prunus armeniaca]